MPEEIETDEAWYRDGLAFTCTQCGKCCTGAPGFVWVDDAEMEAIATRLGESVEQVKAVYARKARRGMSLREKANGDCIFYDRKKGCTIYDIRPKQCRTWPFWASNIDTPESWQHTCEICPGSVKGQLFSFEDIMRRMNEIIL